MSKCCLNQIRRIDLNFIDNYSCTTAQQIFDKGKLVLLHSNLFFSNHLYHFQYCDISLWSGCYHPLGISANQSKQL